MAVVKKRIFFGHKITDGDGDGILTEEEFVSLPLGEINDEERKNLDKEWKNERETEFRNSIDRNQDGKVTKEELKVLMPHT